MLMISLPPNEDLSPYFYTKLHQSNEATDNIQLTIWKIVLAKLIQILEMVSKLTSRMQESFHYFKYKKSENILYQYADDIAPRHLTSALPLDYDTVAGGDKFGNVFITRLPADISAQVLCCQEAIGRLNCNMLA